MDAARNYVVTSRARLALLRLSRTLRAIPPARTTILACMATAVECCLNRLNAASFAMHTQHYRSPDFPTFRILVCLGVGAVTAAKSEVAPPYVNPSLCLATETKRTGLPLPLFPLRPPRTNRPFPARHLRQSDHNSCSPHSYSLPARTLCSQFFHQPSRRA